MIHNVIPFLMYFMYYFLIVIISQLYIIYYMYLFLTLHNLLSVLNCVELLI